MKNKTISASTTIKMVKPTIDIEIETLKRWITELDKSLEFADLKTIKKIRNEILDITLIGEIATLVGEL